MLHQVFILSLLLFVNRVNSHGRLMEPPNRSTLWRFWDSDPAIMPYKEIIEENWTDNELFCGGFQHQANLGGKCGLCGDPWDGARENEAGGKYGKGIIVRQYQQGSIMDANVELTAHHLGYFEFRLCEWNNPTVPATHDCLNKHLLLTHDGKTQYHPGTSGAGPWHYNIKLQLPSDVKCSQCILQWRYHAENTWNCDDNDKCCLGCGPQEEFYGCADIAIGSEPTLPPPGWEKPPTTTPQTTTTTLMSRLTTIKETTVPPSTTTQPSTTMQWSTTTTTTEPLPPNVITSTAAPSDGPSCEGKTVGQYLSDCTNFYTCGNDEDGPYLYACPPGTVYDEIRKICDYAYNVPPPCGEKA